MNKSKIRIFSLRNVIYILILSIIISALVYSSTYNYLLFHTIVELVTILIGFGVFIFAWNSRQFSDSNFITFIGISFLSISSIDLLHTLAYKGMHIFQGYDSNLPTQLWIAARFLQSISFLIALLYLRRKLKPYLIVLGYFLVTVLLVSSIFLSIFPDCYIEGSGLTDFKITSEYLISLIFIIATVLIIKNRKEFDNKVFIWIVVSLILMIGGEIAFTFYVSVYGLSNLVGHIFKLVSFYFIYLSIIEIGIKKPFDLLFRRVDQNIKKLGVSNRDLTNTVAKLEEEIGKRKTAEKEIKGNNIRLRILSEILQHQFETVQGFLDYALEQGLYLTQSKLGYIYFYDEVKQEFTLSTWSQEVMEECTVQDPETIYQLEETGIWGEAVRQRKPIVMNNFQAPHPLKKGYPEGHAHLRNFLTIPVINNGKITAVVGVANKPGDYSETDALQLTLLMGSVWKVVEQRQKDEALHTSEEQFYALAHSASDAIININSDGHIVYWNKAAEKIFGFTAKEMIGNPLDKIMPEEFQQAHFDGINRVVSTGKSRIIGKIVEVVGINKKGRNFPIELSLATWKVNKEIFFTAIIRDITDRKKMDEKMRLDSLMLTNIIDGILLYKVSDETIVYTNPQFETLFGYDPGELIGQHVSILNVSDQANVGETAKAISEDLLLNGTWDGEIQNVKKDGRTFWCHASISVFTHPEFGKVWVSVQQDISQRKKMQQDLTLLSTHDALTGLYNRAFFGEEMNRFERGRDFPISVIMADVDGLKKINDTYGHASGDLLLKRAANVLAKSFRGDDIVARIGGDEFAILLPNADEETANQALKRIYRNIQENNKRNIKFQLNISCGASTAEFGQDLKDALKLADKKMYNEKNKEKLG